MKKLKLLLVFALYMVSVFAVIKLMPNKDENAAWDRIEKRNTERYEKMLKTEGKIVLNKETIEEDHKDCVENYKDREKINKHTVIEFIFIMIFTTIFIWYCMILQNPNHPIKSFVGAVIIGMFGILIVLGSSSDDKKHLDEPYKYVEENIKVKKDSYRENSGHKYILCTDDGRELEVEEHLYDRVDGAGKYYLAETESGVVLNLYPADKFTLEK